MRLQSTFSIGALGGIAAALSFIAGGCLGSSTASPALGSGPVLSLDCGTEGGAPRMAPHGYYTNGTAVCTAAHRPHLFHGVARPSFEWSPAGDHISATDFQKIAGWRANVVRVALNQDFWLAAAKQYDPAYKSAVDQAVRWAEAAGLDVILDLHWSDQGNLAVTKSTQQNMADVNSIQFWTEVATRYKDDGRVLFELYNEPHDISPDAWLNGGTVAGYAAVGMQDLYNAVRAAGADNLVIAGGINWAYSLTALPGGGISGYNVMYAVHPYNKSDNQPAGWDSNWGFVATTNFAPVIATEFGDSTAACSGAWDATLIEYLDHHQMSWTAWAWYPGSCGFPSLVADWTGTPTIQGQVVKDALSVYPVEVTSASDAGPEGSGSAADAGAVAPTDSAGAPDSLGDDSSLGPPAEGGEAGADSPADGPAD